MLQPDGAASTPATVRGTVIRQGGTALSASLVSAELSTPLEPLMDPARVTVLRTQTGVNFMAEPWFGWRSLATQTSVAGAYEFEVPAGVANLYAFRYGFKAKTTEADLAAAAVKQVDFDLQPR